MSHSLLPFFCPANPLQTRPSLSFWLNNTNVISNDGHGREDSSGLVTDSEERIYIENTTNID